MKRRILLIDPSQELEHFFNSEDFEVTPVFELTGALKALKESRFDGVFVRARGVEVDHTVRVLTNRNPLLTTVLFAEKDIPISELVTNLVDLIIELPLKPDIIDTLRSLFIKKDILYECELVGRSKELLEIGELIMRFAPTDVTILLVGESGVGKELVSRAIHNQSGRRGKPFVAVNCGAIPETLLESELFGHEKGAFTGAVQLRRGYFEQAHTGTIFLDEIGELTNSAQVKLLRILETKEFFRVGGTTPLISDFRLIAATNRDLKESVLNGKFRADLYFRIAGTSIYIPPLRERPKDIPVLAYKFMMELAQSRGVSFGGFSDDALSLMMAYHWPGNVRELKNFVEKALLLSEGRVIRARDISSYFEEHSEFGRSLPTKFDSSVPSQLIFDNLQKIWEELKAIKMKLSEIETEKKLSSGSETLNIEETEKKLITSALEKTKGNKVQAAKFLGFSTKTLYRKMKKYGLR